MKKGSKVLIAGFLVLILVSGIGYATVKKNREESQKQHELKIEHEMNEVDNRVAKIVAEKDSIKRLSMLKSLDVDGKNYDKSKNKNDRVMKGYQSGIAKVVKIFTDENNKTLEEAKIAEIDKEADKSKISKSVEVFSGLIKTMDSQADMVYSKSNLEDVKKKINDLINTYNKRLAKINEDEVKAKQETDKKQAEAKTAAETVNADASTPNASDTSIAAGAASNAGNSYAGDQTYNGGADYTNSYAGQPSYDVYVSDGSGSGGSSSYSAPASSGGGYYTNGGKEYGYNGPSPDKWIKNYTYIGDDGVHHMGTVVNGQDQDADAGGFIPGG